MILITLLIQVLQETDQRANSINHSVLKDYLLAVLTHGKKKKKKYMKLIKDEKPTFLPQEPQLDCTEWITMGFMFMAHLQENSESRN